MLFDSAGVMSFSGSEFGLAFIFRWRLCDLWQLLVSFGLFSGMCWHDGSGGGTCGHRQGQPWSQAVPKSIDPQVVALTWVVSKSFWSFAACGCWDWRAFCEWWDVLRQCPEAEVVELTFLQIFGNLIGTSSKSMVFEICCFQFVCKLVHRFQHAFAAKSLVFIAMAVIIQN